MLTPLRTDAQTAVLSLGDTRSSELTLYLFAPVSTQGSSTVAGQGADIDMDLSDALDVLDFTISGRYELWQGDWGLIVEGNHLGISDDVSLTLPGSIGVGLNIDVEVEQSWVSLMGAYRFGRSVSDGGMPYVFDVSGGIRYNHLRQEVKITNPMGDVIERGGTESWFEPVIGFRAAMALNDQWATAIILDASGFGVEGNDLAFSATWAFNKQLSDQMSLRFGYRYYSINYETDRSDGVFGYDVDQHGPFIGLGFTF
ncbi:MAG: hypothetical protein ABJK89_13550 [Paracoccaceae bacterium]